MMKNIFIVFTVLAMASVANAVLTISVDGVVDPPDTEVKLKVGETAVIDVHSTGAGGPLSNEGYFLKAEGPATLDITAGVNTFNPPGYPDSIFMWEWEPYAGWVFLDLAKAVYPPVEIPEGMVIDGLVLTCTDLGDVTLTLEGDLSGVLDTQVIHQIPEPITFALLGLGGLFLRRRK
jgi:hypothetical protein